MFGVDLGYALIVALVVSTPGLVLAVYVMRKHSHAQLARDGRRVTATVVDVRDDRSDMQTIVTYRFTDRSTGRDYSRTGVLQRDVALPRPGQSIDIVYLPSRPQFSRLSQEESWPTG